MQKKWLEFSNSGFSESVAGLIAPIIAAFEGLKTEDVLKNLRQNFATTRKTQGGNLADIDAATAAKQKKIEGKRQGEQDILAQDVLRRQKAEARAATKAEAALAAAQAELAALNTEANQKATVRRLADGTKAPGKPGAPGAPALPTAAAIGGTAVGTFSAAQVAMMGGGGGVQEQIHKLNQQQLKAMEKSIKVDEKILRAIRNPLAATA